MSGLATLNSKTAVPSLLSDRGGLRRGNGLTENGRRIAVFMLYCIVQRRMVKAVQG